MAERGLPAAPAEVLIAGGGVAALDVVHGAVTALDAHARAVLRSGDTLSHGNDFADLEVPVHAEDLAPAGAQEQPR